jgi:hypothetical protein
VITIKWDLGVVHRPSIMFDVKYQRNHDSSIKLAVLLNYLSGLDDTKECNKKNLS